MTSAQEKAVIAPRLSQYEACDATEQRNRLVAMWRKHHPEAANETSSTIKPLICYRRRIDGDAPSEPDEYWCNDTYNVTVRRHKHDRPDTPPRRVLPVFGTSKGGMVQLGICSLDGSARHDWRDFQAIKNQLAGPECEAFELYPAESRLLDPSNYYSLWCFPGVNRIRVGQTYRHVLDADAAMAPQRGLGKR